MKNINYNSQTGEITITEIEFQEVIAPIIDFEPEKRYEIKATEKQYLDLVIAVPDLLDYIKQSSIKVYEHENFRLFYVNTFLPGHREILEYYLGLKSITDRNRNRNGNE